MKPFVSGSRSITRTLLLLIALPLALLVLLSSLFSAYTANRSVTRLYEQQMQSLAEVLLTFVLYETNEMEDDDYEEQEDEQDDNEHLNDELLEVVSGIQSERGLPANFRLIINGRQQFASSNLTLFPSCSNGHSKLRHPSLDTTDPEWYCYRQNETLLGSRFNASVEIFESARQRKRDVRTLVLATFAPLFLLPIAVLLFTAWGVAYAMRSVKQVSNEVGARSVKNLQRLSIDDQPQELQSVVRSVNVLLAGIEKGLTREKQFSDDAAHELRTPLTSMKMLEQLLRRDNKDPALEEYLADLKLSIDQSNDLINQLLSSARLQSLESLEMSSVNLSESLRVQLELLSPQLLTKNISIKFSRERKQVLVIANQPALNILINNLLSNAIKFSANDGVIYLEVDENQLRVEDDGPGIPIEEQEKIFERFYRSANGKGVQGNGLGLALAKWVADVHGYDLAVESALYGSGAAFVLSLISSEVSR